MQHGQAEAKAESKDSVDGAKSDLDSKDAKGGDSKADSKGVLQDEAPSAKAGQSKEGESKEGSASTATRRLSSSGAAIGPKEAFVRQVDTSDPAASASDTNVLMYSFVKAQDSALDIQVPGVPLGYNDIAEATAMPFAKKVEWFHKQIAKLKIAWEYGHMKINIRRTDLLTDSVFAFNKIKKDDLRC